MILLSSAYLGNVQYYSKLITGKVLMERCENYQKQSYRNRCDIMTSTGVVSLTVPVIKSSGEKTPIKDVRIDYSKQWQHQHWYSIFSSYRNSPYFDYFEEDFHPFYHSHYEFLWDFNEGMRETVSRLMGLSYPIEYTKEYVESGDFDDFRNCISPKPRLNREDSVFAPKEYYQVFSDKIPFAPNLSIIDLLFCEGRDGINFLL